VTSETVPLRRERPVTCEGACEPDPYASTLTAFGDLVVELESPVSRFDLVSRIVDVDVRTRYDGRDGLTRFSIRIGAEGRLGKITRAVVD
jgi:hypothetical protein